jgi:hypothetical protein
MKFIVWCLGMLVLVALWVVLAVDAHAAVRATAYRASADTLYVDLRINQPGEKKATVFYAGCVEHPTIYGPWFGCGQESKKTVKLHRGRARVGLWVQRLEHHTAYDLASGARHWRSPERTDAARLAVGDQIFEVGVQQHREDG